MEILKYVNRVNLSIIFGLCLALDPFSLVEAKELIISEGSSIPKSGSGPAYWHVADQSKLPHSVKTSPPSDLKKIDIIRDRGKKTLTMQGGTTLEARHMGTKFDTPVKSGTTVKASTLGRGIGRSVGVLGAIEAGGQFLKIKREMQKEDDLYEYDKDCLLYGSTHTMLQMKEGLLDPSCRVAKKTDIIEPDPNDKYVDPNKIEGGVPYWTESSWGGKWSSPAAIANYTNSSCRNSGNGGSASGTYTLDPPLYESGSYVRVCRYTVGEGDNKRDDKYTYSNSIWKVTPEDSFECPVGSTFDGNGCLVDDYDPNPTYDWYPMTDDLVSRVFEDLIDYDHPDLVEQVMSLTNDDIVKSPLALDQIFAYYDEGVLTLTNIPDSIKGDPIINTTTYTDSSGNESTIVTETTPSANFDIGSGGLSVTYTEEITTYENGVKTGSSSSSTTQNPSGGGGSSVRPDSPPAPEIPTDCDLFPSQCRHNEWVETPMSEPPPNSSGDFSDLGVNVTLDDVQGVDVNFGEASCPAPIVVDLIIFEPVEITFYFMCEHAKSAKPFILISASLFALYIILGSNRGKA